MNRPKYLSVFVVEHDEDFGYESMPWPFLSSMKICNHQREQILAARKALDLTFDRILEEFDRGEKYADPVPVDIDIEININADDEKEGAKCVNSK
ncbi:MAG: hypothetical protein GWN93_26790 [Deltaproteobacteria bacterium]|nr:hypothetical protein [Deltaproteobacteria bacterium]